MTNMRDRLSAVLDFLEATYESGEEACPPTVEVDETLRIVADQAGVPIGRYLTGKMSEQDWQRTSYAIGVLAESGSVTPDR